MVLATAPSQIDPHIRTCSILCPHCARHFVYGCLSLKTHRRSRCQNLSLVCMTFAKPSLGFHLHLRCSTHAYVLWGPDLQHCQWTLKAAFLTSAATGTSTSIKRCLMTMPLIQLSLDYLPISPYLVDQGPSGMLVRRSATARNPAEN